METKDTKGILDYCCEVGVKKCANSFKKTAILAFFAGMFIAFGAAASLIASASFLDTMPDFAKFISGAVFPVGLMLVILAGGELFTGNCLIFVAFLRKKIKLKDIIKNLSIVWVFNLIGSLFVIFLMLPTHSFSISALKMLHVVANHKVHSEFIWTLVKGIGCNILVAGAVWISYATKDLIGKIWAIWFPIMAFIILGFDHVVANMFYLPSAILTGALISMSQLIINLIAATIGNVIGGCIVLAFLYEYAYKKNNE